MNLQDLVVTQVVPIAVLLVNILSSFKKLFILITVHFYLKWTFFVVVMMDTFQLYQNKPMSIGQMVHIQQQQGANKTSKRNWL